MYWYVQRDIDGDPHVVCVMHVFDDQSMMMRSVPRYHSKLEEENVFFSRRMKMFYNYNRRLWIEEVVEQRIRLYY